MYLPSVDRETMNKVIDTVKQVIGINSKSSGRNSWLEVKEQVEMVKDAQ